MVTAWLWGLPHLLAAVQVSRVSLLYETAPMYVTDQPAFLNAAVLGRTDLPPLQLLYHCKQIEKQAGGRLPHAVGADAGGVLQQAAAWGHALSPPWQMMLCFETPCAGQQLCQY